MLHHILFRKGIKCARKSLTKQNTSALELHNKCCWNTGNTRWLSITMYKWSARWNVIFGKLSLLHFFCKSSFFCVWKKLVLTWFITVFWIWFHQKWSEDCFNIYHGVSVHKATTIVMCDEKLIAGFSSAMQSVDNCSWWSWGRLISRECSENQCD